MAIVLSSTPASKIRWPSGWRRVSHTWCAIEGSRRRRLPGAGHLRGEIDHPWEQVDMPGADERRNVCYLHLATRGGRFNLMVHSCLARRGVDHSAPKAQYWLYQYFGWDMRSWCHDAAAAQSRKSKLSGQVTRPSITLLMSAGLICPQR